MDDVVAVAVVDGCEDLPELLARLGFAHAPVRRQVVCRGRGGRKDEDEDEDEERTMPLNRVLSGCERSIIISLSHGSTFCDPRCVCVCVCVCVT